MKDPLHVRSSPAGLFPGPTSLRPRTLPSPRPGLYIHIPFCRSKCPYCHFFSSTSLSAAPEFLAVLGREMEMVRERFEPFDSLYLGGGTPSLLRAGEIEFLLQGVRRNFLLLPGAEITLEANPADLDLPFLTSLRGLGINRLHLGIQSFDSAILEFLGRRHSASQARRAFEMGRRAGFANLGVDLLYGVPGQTPASWRDTLSQALALAPEHLSCYQLTIESGTPFGRRRRRGGLNPPPEDRQVEFFIETSARLEEAGYIQYEVSNFARGPAWTSRHNQKYWDHTPYLGLGPSAHSFLDYRRWWNHPSLEDYGRAVGSGALPIQGMETLTPEQLCLEALFLGLRTRRGIHLAGFAARYHFDLLAEKGAVLAKLEEEGLLSLQDGWLRPTRSGLAVADRLALL